eukprot:scaffold29192_cov84-Isochrysis_galbana.AAC.1
MASGGYSHPEPSQCDSKADAVLRAILDSLTAASIPGLLPPVHVQVLSEHADNGTATGHGAVGRSRLTGLTGGNPAAELTGRDFSARGGGRPTDLTGGDSGAGLTGEGPAAIPSRGPPPAGGVLTGRERLCVVRRYLPRGSLRDLLHGVANPALAASAKCVHHPPFCFIVHSPTT